MMKGRAFAFLMAIISVGIFSLSFGLQEVYGDPEKKPEKIRIDNIRWDTNTQQFFISGDIQFGIATAGEHADFLIILKTAIYDSQTGEHLYTIIWMLNELTKRLKEFEVSQPWDRNTNRRTGESFEGNVDIIVEGAILSPSGKAVDFLEPIAFEDIPVIPIDCSGGRVCPDGATCLFGLCVPDNAPVPLFCDDNSDCPPVLTCTFGICLPF